MRASSQRCLCKRVMSHWSHTTVCLIFYSPNRSLSLTQFCEEYRKAHNLLLPFDPSASYVHPDARVHITITLGKPRAGSTASPFPPMELEYPEEVPDSTPVTSDEDYEEPNSPVAGPSNERRLPRIKLKLPFSPRKTLNRKLFTTDDSDETTEIQRRYSTRTRLPTKASLGHEDYKNPSDSESNDSVMLKHARKDKNRAKQQRKVAPPTYGYVRNVADLEYDSDEDSGPLRAHRRHCERCKEQAAHVRLEKISKSKSSKRRRKKADEFEESEDEEGRFLRLGGWMQWSA